MLSEKNDSWQPGDFKALGIEDKEIISSFFKLDPPRISELNFSNLFMWRHQYHPWWQVSSDCLVIVCTPTNRTPFGFQPVGPGNKRQAFEFAVEQLRTSGLPVRLERVDRDFVDHFVDPQFFNIEFDRDNSDYVYLCRQLITLAGRKMHRKKNHLNQFLKSYRFQAKIMDVELVECVLEMQEAWCRLKDCDQHPALANEDRAIFEALKHFEYLDYQGMALIIDSKVEAFTLGEPLNPETVVVHIEKANPALDGAYAAINQMFCQELWSGYEFINREQDLGSPSLRQAKQSYYPHHLEEKYLLTLR